MAEKKIPSGNVLQNVILESRKKLSVSGVEDVDSFDENEVVVYTSLGLVEVKGNDIHMNKLNLEVGEIILEGEFDSIVYVEEGAVKNKKGFFSKMFGGED